MHHQTQMQAEIFLDAIENAKKESQSGHHGEYDLSNASSEKCNSALVEYVATIKGQSRRTRHEKPA